MLFPPAARGTIERRRPCSAELPVIPYILMVRIGLALPRVVTQVIRGKSHSPRSAGSRFRAAAQAPTLVGQR